MKIWRQNFAPSSVLAWGAENSWTDFDLFNPLFCVSVTIDRSISIAFSEASDYIAERKSKIALHRERKFQSLVTKRISIIIDRKHQL